MPYLGDNRLSSVAIFAFAALAVGACATAATQLPEDFVYDDPAEQSGDLPVALEPEPPAFIPPPEPAPESWAMPDVEQRKPTFPYLPGEPAAPSRSVGGVTHGWLINAKPILQPHPHLKLLPVQYQRGLHYTSDPMLDLVEGAAAHVAREHPGSVVYLGNFSAQGGGDIPYSVSHNSGRDADLGFFVRTPEGEAVMPPDLLPLDDDGRYEGEHGTYEFDPERNWALVEGLIEAGGDRLQYIFISNSLKRALLAEARRQKADRRVVARARQLLHQPGGALPHNDHFHIRIYCSELDVRSGCEDRGRKHSWYDSHRRAWRETVRDAKKALASEDASVRLAGVRRLALLEARGAASKIAELVEDADPKVRAASARALATLGRQERAIAKRLEDETHPQVVVELIGALGQAGGSTALDALTAALEQPRPVALPGEIETDARAFVAEALVELEQGAPVDELIALLGSDDADVRISAARALRILTNHSLATRAELEAPPEQVDVLARWEKWYDEHGAKERDEWLACGFQDAGYDVDGLSVRHVWDLCRAVADADHLSYNAQRVLMRLSGREPASLSWPKHDANFYWRRWFERRWRRFGAPPIPEELSTLD